MTFRDKLDLPPGYLLDESDRPFLHILQPSGRRVPNMRFGTEADPRLVEEAVRQWDADADEKVAGLDLLLGRGEHSDWKSPKSVGEYRHYWAENTTVSYGFCWCGCGASTKVADRTRSSKLMFKGEPIRYVLNHHCIDRELRDSHEDRWKYESGGISYGRCWCGCEQVTPLSRCTDTRSGAVEGKPLRFCPNHQLDEAREVGIELARKPCIYEDRGYVTPCRIYSGRVSGGGYAQITVGGKTVMLHRFVYEQEVGPIPEGLELDHLCYVRNCVNPEHLEPVTRSENIRRQRRYVERRQRLADEESFHAAAERDLARRRSTSRSGGWGAA